MIKVECFTANGLHLCLPSVFPAIPATITDYEQEEGSRGIMICCNDGDNGGSLWTYDETVSQEIGIFRQIANMEEYPHFRHESDIPCCGQLKRKILTKHGPVTFILTHVSDLTI